MELNQTSICYYDQKLGRTATCTESTDAIVPDTFPDIGRVVCAYGMAAIKDQTPQNGRLLVSGTVKTAVLYQPEDGEGIRRLSIPISFAHIEECEGIDADAVCFVSCKVASVDAVPVNSRKISINVQLCFEVEGYQKATCTITESTDLPDLEILSASREVPLIEQAETCIITILEDTTISGANDLELLHSSCSFKTTECRAMQGKVILKGDAVVTCVALQEDNKVRVINNNTPFTQILEMPDVREGDIIQANITAKEINCRLESDGLLSYTISAAALFTSHNTHIISQIEDLYLPGKELHIKEEQANIQTMPMSVPFTGETNETISAAYPISNIISATGLCCGCKRTDANTIQITASIQVLYLNDKDQLCALQRMLPLAIPCNMKGTLSQVELNVRASAKNEQEVAITVTVSGCLINSEKCVFRNITNAEVMDKEEESNGITLVMRFIDEEQQLWDIAKSCGTTIEAVRSANELAPETKSVANTMLLIPVGI